MPLRPILLAVLTLPLVTQTTSPSTPTQLASETRAAALRTLIESSPRLPLQQSEIPIHLPAGQQLGKVSWITMSRSDKDPKTGTLWLIQRGPQAPPILALDPAGNVLHAFGTGLFTIPHAIRLDPQGNVWTVDAGSSTVLKFSPEGKQLLKIDIGTPATTNPFHGATDIAFAPNGHLFISDGYANARILEYSPTGLKLHEFGAPGTAPGQFHLPHSIVMDRDSILYIADRENGRIQKFTLTGQFLGEIPNLGRTYSLALAPDGALWASMAPLNQPTGAPGWIVKLDPHTGKILAHIPVTESGGLHTIALTPTGQPITAIANRILLFHP